MRVLALDTSSIVASAAVIDEQKLSAEMIFNYKKQHSTILMPMIDRLLKSLELDISDVDGVACAAGPGSFTGLRIGAATAKGLCHGAGKTLIAVPTLDALANNIPLCAGLVCPIMDALRDNVYTALYRWDRGIMDRKSDYMAVPVDELIQKLSGIGECVTFVGDGVPVQRERLAGELGERARFAPVHLMTARASSLGEIALQRLREGRTDDFMTFAPFYLRKSQAEREYEKRRRGDK